MIDQVEPSCSNGFHDFVGQALHRFDLGRTGVIIVIIINIINVYFT